MVIAVTALKVIRELLIISTAYTTWSRADKAHAGSAGGTSFLGLQVTGWVASESARARRFRVM
jgi:hypothetical protein